MPLRSFKAYDIRGRLSPEIGDINIDFADALGRATVEFLNAETLVLGHDVRPDSPALADACARGARAAGAQVRFIGQCGTEEVYFKTGHFGADAGIMVTASHNPMDYNGMKLVRADAAPISADSGLAEISKRMEQLLTDPSAHNQLSAAEAEQIDDHDKSDYIEKLMSFVGPLPNDSRTISIAANAGNGPAGAVVDALVERLPINLTRVHWQPDPTFPNGIPNPLLPERREDIIRATLDSGAEMGIAWDGDFDRCFFVDAKGRFIEGYYIVALLAEATLRAEQGAGIVYDPRLIWATQAVIAELSGADHLSKSGHAFIKEKMRAVGASYGGEMSAHHYFRDFFYCDSGMLPWVLIVKLLLTSGKTLAELVDDTIEAYPCSGEINFTVDDPNGVFARVQQLAEAEKATIELIDGLSADFGDWRFNLRKSNTEPLVRLNVEARGNAALMEAKTSELKELIAAG